MQLAMRIGIATTCPSWRSSRRLHTTPIKWKPIQPRRLRHIARCWRLIPITRSRSTTFRSTWAASTTFWKDIASGDLSSIESTQGHLARSEADIRDAEAVDESAGAMGLYFGRVAQLAQLDIRHQVRVSQALASLSEARAKHPFG